MSKVVGIRFPDEEREDIEKIAKSSGLTLTDAVRICLEGISRGHYEIVNRELVPTTEYKTVLTPTFDEPKYDYEALGVDRLLETLERKNYNLRDTIANMTQSASDAPAYSRKRGMDWGA